MGWIIGIGLFILVILPLYCCCVVSGRSSRLDEELERQHKSSVLSDLENETLEKLLQVFEEDGVNFIINNGKVVDYEVED